MNKLELVEEGNSPEAANITNITVMGADGNTVIGVFKDAMGYQFGPAFAIITAKGGNKNHVFPFANFSELIVTVE